MCVNKCVCVCVFGSEPNRIALSLPIDVCIVRDDDDGDAVTMNERYVCVFWGVFVSEVLATKADTGINISMMCVCIFGARFTGKQSPHYGGKENICNTHN